MAGEAAVQNASEFVISLHGWGGLRMAGGHALRRSAVRLSACRRICNAFAAAHMHLCKPVPMWRGEERA